MPFYAYYLVFQVILVACNFFSLFQLHSTTIQYVFSIEAHYYPQSNNFALINLSNTKKLPLRGLLGAFCSKYFKYVLMLQIPHYFKIPSIHMV